MLDTQNLSQTLWAACCSSSSLGDPQEGCPEGRCAASLTLASERAGGQHGLALCSCSSVLALLWLKMPPCRGGMLPDQHVFPLPHFLYYRIFWSCSSPGMGACQTTQLFCPELRSFITGVRFPPGFSVHSHCHQWPPSTGWSPCLHLETV